MKCYAVLPNSLVNGKGIRDVVFMSGCIHNCDGCHNKEYQDINKGRDMSVEEIVTTLKENNGMVDGITISGGDPLFQPNETILLCKSIKEELKNNNIWVYTGYTFEFVKDNYPELLKYVDVIVDGKFEKEQTHRGTERPLYRGSFNQRIIHVESAMRGKKYVCKENN